MLTNWSDLFSGIWSWFSEPLPECIKNGMHCQPLLVVSCECDWKTWITFEIEEHSDRIQICLDFLTDFFLSSAWDNEVEALIMMYCLHETANLTEFETWVSDQCQLTKAGRTSTAMPDLTQMPRGCALCITHWYGLGGVNKAQWSPEDRVFMGKSAFDSD